MGLGEWEEAFLSVARGYGEGAVRLVSEGCTAILTVMHRECVGGILFKPQGGGEDVLAGASVNG